MFQKLLNTLTAQKQEQRSAQLYRNLIRHEAKIGGQLFGKVEKSRRREFFCLDEHTWVWHEEWVDAQGQRKVVTTRYDVRPGNGILKSQNGGHYQALEQEEARNLLEAVRAYQQKVNQELYANII
ncbi:hypothetical protein KC963_01710 [Candidatus Saccharibacteria bacterium]|nr:hypothetical protein [Candidatus Saccharibacteria bacterium]